MASENAQFEFAPAAGTRGALASPTGGSWFGGKAPASGSGSAGAATRSPLQAVQPAGDAGADAAAKPKSNIVTSWGAAPAGGFKRVARAAEPAPAAPQAPRSTAAAAAVAKPVGSSTPAAPRSTRKECVAAAPAAAAAAPAPAAAAHEQQLPLLSPRTEGAVTRSMSRLLGAPLSPPVEAAKALFSPASGTKRRAQTAVKRRRTPLGRRSLHRVANPAISKPKSAPRGGTTARGNSAAGSGKRPASGGAAPGPSPFKSLAQKVRDFHVRTPPRFRTAPRGGAVAPGSSGGAAGRRASLKPQLTEAQEPLLRTAARARPRRFKTREEEDEEEMARGTFHARPVDPTVFSGARTGRPSSAETRKPAPTEPKPFSFASDERARRRASTGGNGAAAPGGLLGGVGSGPASRTRGAMDRGSILDGAAGFAAARPPAASGARPLSAGRAPRPSLTIPQSPLLRTKTRSHSPAPQRREAPRSEFKARPAPKFDSFGAKCVPFVAPKEPTQPEPFRLATDDRHRLHEAQMAAKLEVERRMPRAPTAPAPYRLRSEARHFEAVAKHGEQLRREEEEARRAAEFKARPIYEPSEVFAPRASEAPLTVPDDVALATEERAVERDVFDQAVAERMAQEEAERQRQAELKRKREEEETREYRKTLLFKARPMPNFEEPFFTVPSEKEPTRAKSPGLALRKRARRV